MVEGMGEVRFCSAWDWHALCLSSQLGGADGGLRPDSSVGAAGLGAGLGNRVKPRRYAPHPRWDGQARMRLRCQCVKAGGEPLGVLLRVAIAMRQS